MKTEILKAIEALTPLTKEQIAEQVDCLSSFLPEKIVERIKTTQATPDEVAKWYKPYFHRTAEQAMTDFERAKGEDVKPAKAKVFLLISIYYHYSDCMEEQFAERLVNFYLNKTKG